MQDAVRQAYTHVAVASGPDAEFNFNAYLTSAPQTMEDVVGWWGVCLLSLPEFLTESVLRSIAFNTLHGRLSQEIISQYKDLRLLQNGYLFSSSGITGTDRRNCLDPVTFEEIQILKHAYKSNMISAGKENQSREHTLDEEDAFWNSFELHDDDIEF